MHSSILNLLKSEAFLPLFYNESAQTCVEITKALYTAGVRCIEFTNRGSKALINFKTLIELRNTEMPDLLLGIGTIKSIADVQAFADAKADFLISPFFDQEISDYVNQHHYLWIPGCMTPSEINSAIKGGHRFIKLFPGNIFGQNFVKSIKPLFPEANFMITGGVSTEEDNLRSWFEAGAIAVGLGSNLIPNQINTAADYINITEKAIKTKAIITQLI